MAFVTEEANDGRSKRTAPSESLGSQPSLHRITPALLERFGNVLGSKRLYYAELDSFVCSLIVGVAEGLPATSATCRPRVVVALVATVVQCALNCTSSVPLEALLEGILSLCVVPMSVLVTVQVFAEGGDEDGGAGLALKSTAIAVLLLLANILGIVLLIIAVLGGVAETLLTSHREDHHHPSHTRRASDPPPLVCERSRSLPTEFDEI